MLSDLLEIYERVLRPTAQNRSHTTEGRTLQLLASVQRVSILDQSHVVTGDLLNQVLGSRELGERYLEMIPIVENVEQILVERVYVVELGELIED